MSPPSTCEPGVGGEAGEDCRQPVARHPAVGVGAGDDRRPRQAYAAVARRPGARAGLLGQPHAGEAGDRRVRQRPRAVVDHDHLGPAHVEVLGEERVEQPAQQLRLVEMGDDDADLGEGGPASGLASAGMTDPSRTRMPVPPARRFEQSLLARGALAPRPVRRRNRLPEPAAPPACAPRRLYPRWAGVGGTSGDMRRVTLGRDRDRDLLPRLRLRGARLASGRGRGRAGRSPRPSTAG